jgi:hypothetical protein
MPIVPDSVSPPLIPRRVTLINNPYTNPLNSLPWVLGQDNRGYQFQIALDALPPGVNINQVKQNQVWFIENSTTAYRLSLYAGSTYSPLTVTSGSFVGLNNYGSYYSTVTQSGTISGQAMTYNQPVTNVSGVPSVNGVQISGGSRIYLDNPGVYNLQFSAQFQTTSKQGNDVYIWLRHSGVDVEDSTTVLTLVDPANTNPKLVAAWNFFTPTTTVGQYFEIMWYSEDSHMLIYKQNSLAAGSLAVGSPYIPGIPSVILTVNQVA